MLPVAYGESAMCSTQVQLRYNRFKEDLEDINYVACPGRPSMTATDENIEAVK